MISYWKINCQVEKLPSVECCLINTSSLHGALCSFQVSPSLLRKTASCRKFPAKLAKCGTSIATGLYNEIKNQ